ncbi:hypothetical protein [Arthrobacter sp. UYEF36]|uniref:hypothetical protein n=1 Tax=Arthrobacter sp. UYEF36 TaxID=1756366 RepID=UPI003392264C
MDGRLDDQAIHWLQTNFLKAEPELGHCLRLPAEEPSECELMLSCPGLPREVERHQGTQRRIRQLLNDLDEQPDSI